jgi:hypothetical protein
MYLSFKMLEKVVGKAAIVMRPRMFVLSPSRDASSKGRIVPEKNVRKRWGGGGAGVQYFSKYKNQQCFSLKVYGYVRT